MGRGIISGDQGSGVSVQTQRASPQPLELGSEAFGNLARAGGEVSSVFVLN